MLLICAGAGSLPAPGADISHGGVAQHSGRAWCEAKPNLAWKKALARGPVALSRRYSVVPWGAANDGRTFFGSVYTKAFSGVVRVDAATSRFTRIKRFPNSRSDQADGSFDGRWLVWDEYHSLAGSDDFTTWSWDSVTGRKRQIGAAERAPSGDFWQSPWREPDARYGYATWAQGVGEDGLAEVHVVELASGRDRVVRRGHAQGSFLVEGPRVLWPESLKPDTTTVLLAADAVTGTRVAPPRATRGVHGAAWTATDGHALAFPQGNFTSIEWSPSLTTPPKRVFATRLGSPKGYPIEVQMQVAGRYAAFVAEPRSYLVDTLLGRYIEIKQGGWTRLDRKAFVLVPPSPKKAIHLVSDVLFFPLSSLPPIPPCR